MYNIQVTKMFLFEEAHMYLVIISAVIVGAISLALIKNFNLKTINKEEVQVKGKPLHKGTIIGGTTFGLGWAVTGACPGPIYAQIGSGEYLALLTLGGALLGMYLYARFQIYLPH